MPQENTMQRLIVREAREWLGTPFRHQGRRKTSMDHKGGVDCLGLLIGVAKECDLKSANGDLIYRHDMLTYGHMPDGIALRQGLEDVLTLKKKECASLGDVGLFSIDGVVRHVGFCGDYDENGLSLIHAYANQYT